MRFYIKDPLSKINIKYKLPFGFITLFLIIFGIGGYFVMNVVYEPLNREIFLRLQSETFAQKTIFDKKLETLKRRAEDFSSDGFIRSLTFSLIRDSKDSPAGQAKLQEQLKRHLLINKLPLVPEFVDLQIFDGKKRLLTNAKEKYVNFPLPVAQYDLSADIQFTPFIIQENTVPISAILVPIWNIERSEKIGFIACLVDLTAIIRNSAHFVAGTEKQAEVEKYLTLIDQDGTRIEVPWWYLKATARQGSLSDEEKQLGLRVERSPQKRVYASHNGPHICENGLRMYGQTYPLSDPGWTTLVELNAAEALKPIRRLEAKLIGFTLTITVAVLILLFFPVQYLVRPLSELQRMASKIKEGDFSVRNRVESEDEIGNLARTLNLMADAVEERTHSLEKTAADLRNRERELRLQHDRLQTVVHSMTDGLLLLNDAGEVMLSNAAAAPIQDFLQNSDLSPDIRKCNIHETVSNHCIHCLLNPQRTTSCELALSDRIFEVISTNMPALDGSPGKLLVARDITERERMNQRQAHQERLSVLGKTAAVVAHELNSPLAAISMYNQMLEVELPADSPFLEHVHVIQRNTQVCQKIIRELLDYARLPKPKSESVELQPLVNDIIRFVQPLNKEKKVPIDTALGRQAVTLYGDATQLQQVFVNLLDNALQAVEPGQGRIAITVQVDQGRKMVHIDVSDNGTGVPSDKKKDIFEPFVTTRNIGGTGLGLPTARRIVRAHGGELMLLRSKPGETVFRVALPLVEQPVLSEHDVDV